MKNKIGILKNDKYIFSIVNSVILLFAIVRFIIGQKKRRIRPISIAQSCLTPF
jgi:hypothetical protein